jgi:hypothetical protein
MRTEPNMMPYGNYLEWTNGSRATGSLFLKNSKMAFESLKKIGTKILDVDNYETY